MRIAAISDIHGNLPALRAVLDDIARRGADVTVNCGDILSGPLWPAETAEHLMALGLPTIAGNHERQLLQCVQRRGGTSDQYGYEHTTPAQRQWLAALPATLAPAPGVYVCHGQPATDLEYLLETVEPATGSRPARSDEVAARLAGSPGALAGLVLCGHSHLPRTAWIAGNEPGAGTLCVNAGSVGLPAYDDDHGGFHIHETGSPHARYALCEHGAQGWTVALIAVAYDWAAASAQAARAGADDWARWLATGRATSPH
ncbi:metallophosphoesterase family protein [Variovorax terrae]|uniref:Metallophosphatase family protein n=1 Tax=Variovorax terrae TaxID=2923278 RepID=A0A9X2AMA7_9BURK|nr:metallophosphoesterase family protein [Variovorax terrae]MCJ0763518.1 metallophosphatase family protein [Variovorax terrae]